MCGRQDRSRGDYTDLTLCVLGGGLPDLLGRGTHAAIDLNLPVDYRAAVTLGPGITKDKLAQGSNSNHFKQSKTYRA